MARLAFYSETSEVHDAVEDRVQGAKQGTREDDGDEDAVWPDGFEHLLAFGR